MRASAAREPYSYVARLDGAASAIVIVCVLDYEASRAIFEAAGSALAGRVLVNLTSDTPERAREAAAWAAARGVDYIDGAIMVPTNVIGQPEALLLYSGSQAAFEAHLPTLKALGGSAKFLGPDHGMAALYDMALLDIFFSSMAALMHAFALVGADGVPATTFVPFASEFFGFMPGMAEAAARAVDEGKHPGDFDNVRMEAEGIGHIVQASRARGVDTTGIAAIKSIFDRAVAKGHGADSISSIIEVLKRPGA
ncbi:NAD(P)-dependent oxidoreductase [Sorangium sp. So ce861]|uniref:NAD(P)-dependent oxidoreductase n=1 Tax=Sorangium sp. So ce861 TaxID=3133323 RepID=UPI003F63262A